VEIAKPYHSALLWVAMVALGAGTRLIPHPWNFTPLVAIGLFAGVHARKAGSAAVVTLASLALSDLALGFYRGFWVVYVAALVPVLAGRLIRGGRRATTIALGALASSLSFFVITNFGVWAGGTLYPRTLAGLASCYAAGVPFYRNQLLGDLFYTLVMFGGHAVLTRRWPARATAQASA
jgi:hypothetical protein